MAISTVFVHYRERGTRSLGLVTFNLPEKPAQKMDDGNTLKRRLLGAAVLIALAVIFLPLLLDGSGSESRFRRVEQLRTQPPRILDADGVPELRAESPKPPMPAVQPKVDATSQAESPANSRAISLPKSQALETESDSKDKSTSEESLAEKKAKRERALANNLASKRITELLSERAGSSPVGNANTTSSSSSNEVQNLVAWVVQAGSFSDHQNALNLRDRLRSQGFPAFVTLARSGQSELYRVKVGPMIDRAKAEQSKYRVEQMVGREALVRQYP